MTRNDIRIVLILLFFAAGLLLADPSGGSDLSASYFACRLMISGQTGHLYARDPASFNIVHDPAWNTAEADSGLPSDFIVAPYVQTPFWPYMLQPLCGSTRFPAFNKIFAALIALCSAGLLWVTGRYWATRLFHPIWMALLAIAWIRSNPLHYAMTLTQTHVIFLLMTLVALIWARSGHPYPAGALLAFAAAVKITPGVFLVYWLITGKRKAALSFLVSSATLFALTLLTTGRATVLAYMHSMTRAANTLLVSSNNQSLAAWWMGMKYPAVESGRWHILPLPPAIKVLSLCLIFAAVVIGGYYDRKSDKPTDTLPPYGAVFALIAATMFTPIAWSHYYLVLIVPIMLFLDAYLRQRSFILLAVVVCVVALTNNELLLRHAGDLGLNLPNMVRGQFYAGLFALFGLACLFRREIDSRARNLAGSSASSVP